MNSRFSKETILFIAFLALILLQVSLEALESTYRIANFAEDKTAAGALRKSLLFPGWGQLAEKKYVEGVIFLTAEVCCLANLIYFNHKGNTNYSKYREAETTTDAVRFRDLTEKYDKKRNAYILAAAGVWVLNLLDTYLIVKNKKNPKIGISIQSGKDQRTTLSVSYSF
jgi:hypothetical protein